MDKFGLSFFSLFCDFVLGYVGIRVVVLSGFSWFLKGWGTDVRFGFVGLGLGVGVVCRFVFRSVVTLFVYSYVSKVVYWISGVGRVYSGRGEVTFRVLFLGIFVFL